jgi:hypothetical protein
VDPRNRLTNRWSFIWIIAALANGALWLVLGVWWMLSLSVAMIGLAAKALAEERRERPRLSSVAPGSGRDPCGSGPVFVLDETE